MYTYPKLRRPYPKLWRKFPIGTQNFRVCAQKFRVGNLIFDNFENQYLDFSLPWPPKGARPITFSSHWQCSLINTYISNWFKTTHWNEYFFRILRDAKLLGCISMERKHSIAGNLNYSFGIKLIVTENLFSFYFRIVTNLLQSYNPSISSL